MQRIGIFGGSFDPVHLGHLLVAQAAREELELSRLFFVPAAQSPFKPERQPTAAAERVRLLRLALAGREWCEIDEQEVRRGGISYTIATARDYAGRFTGAVIARPGQTAAPFPAGFRGRVLAGFPLAVSSSQIRARVKGGLDLAGLVPAAVAEAIRNNGLYL
jgi:nicotinate-nucleotide adenylyltransferase